MNSAFSPGHAPLITELGNGKLSYRSSDTAEPVVLAVLSGFAEVLPDRVTVLAETAERPEEIDVERAKVALARAEQRLASGDPDVDWDRASVALQRALVRIEVGTLRRRVHFAQQLANRSGANRPCNPSQRHQHTENLFRSFALE